MKKPKLTFEVKTSRNGQHYWHCIHRNGNILFASETYKRKSSATKSMMNFIWAMSDGSYEVN